MVKLQQVIMTNLSKKGTGQSENSPIRSIIEFYSPEGDLLAKNDPMGNFTIEQLVEFGAYCQNNQSKSPHDLAQFFISSHGR